VNGLRAVRSSRPEKRLAGSAQTTDVVPRDGRCDGETPAEPSETVEKLSGFAGYWLIEADNGVFSSLSLFETPEQSKESTKITASWMRDEKLDTMIPNEPKITSGKVVAHSDRVLVAA
jgi:hypothetical protein